MILHNVFVFLHFIYEVPQMLCVYVLIACSLKILCGIAQLDVGYVTVCSTERMKSFSCVACLDMGRRGCYNMVLELWFSTLSLDGPRNFELRRNFTED